MNRIRELRKQKKMTQKELAKHLQIADSTLSYWEMGKYEPDNESLRKLSRFFLVPIDYILGGDIAEWGAYRDRALHADASDRLLDGNASVVSEAVVAYEGKAAYDDSAKHAPTGFQPGESSGLSDSGAKTTASTRNAAPNGHRETQAVFSRSEFEGLTQDEIDKLAEYSEFLKTQRLKRKLGG